MRWIAGIDGGGSKTAVLLRTVDGKETRTCRVGSIDPAEYGVEGYAAGLLAALTQLGVTAERVAAVCIGIPCFGEYPELDAAVSARTRQLFPNGAVRCENDCYVGFAGAFGLKAGINVVAGTGAIAYGEDEEGHAARSGGWHHDFSDEGSGVWLGRESFALFARQMDGRAPRTAFYEIFREGLGLRRDTDVIDYYARRCAGTRAELAKTQELLLAAAQAGDNSAAALYRKAAGHLCETAAAVYRKLCFQEPVHISYSGGVFQVRDFLLQPFLRQMRQAIPGCVANSPLYTPEEGAALAAALVCERGGEEAVMLLLPADHAIRRRRELTEVLRDAATLAAERPGCLVTIGVPPTGPETAYGYIHCGEELGVRGLTRFYHSLGFREKPDPERARAFVAAGCYRWNSGMFIWQVRSLREAFRRYAPELGELFDDVRTLIREGRLENGLAERFLRSDRISIDYAVMEKAEDVAVAECRFDWDDVGSWTALRNHLPVDGDGNVAEGLFAGIDARNLTVMGSADHLIAAIGVEDLVIVNTGDVTLVCRASEAQRIKELLKLADTRPELRKFL